MKFNFKDQVLAAYEAAKHTHKLTDTIMVSHTMPDNSFDGKLAIKKHTRETIEEANVYIEAGECVNGGAKVSLGFTQQQAIDLALALLEATATEIIDEEDED
jgi:hypothetical protein